MSNLPFILGKYPKRFTARQLGSWKSPMWDFQRPSFLFQSLYEDGDGADKTPTH